ncbi:hypothetical protein BO82DRAFT_364784 [Aspergillus uvarum CBS 121591]|uniref:Zincin n=1 Tax=Aspergillus uvarum CBS 121591 TaxID=1448315 RepID=A0A319C8Z4_9EURO|nr:hypothetical protein BO82DRAFT_364784 [Aspergillus uvarum CBS 121591]PYH81905.1 hypothetical protein BO82DRAFT_364784 [Aspergillus uvarum CBS 121591]
MKTVLHLLVGSLVLQSASSCPSIGHYTASTDTTSSHSNSNRTSATFQKRGYPVVKSSVWPNAKITYCFADPNARSKLKSIVPKAWGMWLNAGASAKFEMEEGETTYCTVANRDSYLLISYNDEHKLVTTPGSIAGLGQDGPSMTLDPSDGFGTGKGMSNIAHEIGHAWGLLHEHQRPSLWTRDFGGTGQRNVFAFNCQNLKDYAAIAAKGNDMDRACHYMQSAVTANGGPFSALDMLPDNRGRDSGTADVVDWDSIMIYGSTAGAATANGQLLNTLTKADGTTYGYNTWPSIGDVNTLNTLYADELDPKKMSKLKMYWNKASPKHGLFLSRNKDSSSSCQ